MRPGRRPTTILARYLIFAVVSTLANLLTQEIVVRSSPVAPLTLSILAGTAVGFAMKYVLDKRWVFADGYRSKADEVRKVSLYGLFSIFTTLLFWSVELGAYAIWRTDVAKYSGAVVGLGLGYALKFLLDRSFVFRERSA
jgi:putative flippase GtrA